jgi:hypothetical protein
MREGGEPEAEQCLACGDLLGQSGLGDHAAALLGDYAAAFLGDYAAAFLGDRPHCVLHGIDETSDQGFLDQQVVAAAVNGVAVKFGPSRA